MTWTKKLILSAFILVAAVATLGQTTHTTTQFQARAPSLHPSPVPQVTTEPIVYRRIVKVNPSPAPRKTQVTSAPTSGGSCTGLADVARMESGGNPRAQNPNSTASGKYQYLDSTWNGYGGYQRASDAPESVQDRRAQADWNRGMQSQWAVC